MPCGCNPPNPPGPNVYPCDPALQKYAAKVGAPLSGPNAWVGCNIDNALKSLRLNYYKVSPGDCDRQTPLPGNLGITGAKVVGQIAARDPEPISKAILSGLSTVFGLFGVSHARAVATEQTTLCQVNGAYNAGAAQIEAAVKAGQLDVNGAAQVLGNLISQLDSALAAISKQGNAAWGYRITLQALLLYNTEVVYPSLTSPLSSLFGGSGSGSGNGLVIAGAGILGLKAIGAF